MPGSHNRKEWFASPDKVEHSYTWDAAGELGCDMVGSIFDAKLPPYRCSCPELLAEHGHIIVCPACTQWNIDHPNTPSATRSYKKHEDDWDMLTRKYGEEMLAKHDKIRSHLDWLRGEYANATSYKAKLDQACIALAHHRQRLGGRKAMPANLPKPIRLPREKAARPQHPHDVPRTIEEADQRLKAKRMARHRCRWRIKSLADQIVKWETKLAELEQRKARIGLPQHVLDDTLLLEEEGAATGEDIA